MSLLQYFLIFTVSSIWLTENGVYSSKDRQIKLDLLQGYDALAISTRPVAKDTDTLRVALGMSVIQLLDVDEERSIITLHVWGRYLWHDEYLQWNPSDYGDISAIRINSNMIWKPDITLYNSNGDSSQTDPASLAVVTSNGDVVWIPSLKLKSSCIMDYSNFPFDIHECQLKFASWTYDGFQLDVDFSDDLKSLDLTQYIENGKWTITNTSGQKHVKYYPCCEEPYPDLIFNLTIRRNTFVFVSIFVFPCVPLTLLSLILYCVPPEKSARLFLGVSVFAAYTIFFVFFMHALPPKATVIPPIGLFYGFNMIMVTVSIIMSIIIMNLYHRNVRWSGLPRWLKLICINGVGRVMCLSSPSNETEKESKNIEWKIFGFVLDKIFFIIHLIAVIVAVISILKHAQYS